MNRRKKYRIFVLWCLGLDLFALIFMGYRYLDQKIPDEIRVIRGQEKETVRSLESPLVTVEESIPVSCDDSYLLSCRILGKIPFKEIKVTPVREKEVCVSGSTVGIYMETDGVLVVDTGEIVTEAGQPEEPAKNIVKPGDYIVSFNHQKIVSKKELIDDLGKLDGGDVVLELNREGETVPVSVTPVKDRSGDYKLGIWVRDDTQGIGTLTYVDDSGNFGALGHGISDIDTAQLLNIRDGALYTAQVLAVTRGSKGSPGEFAGIIRYEPGNILGNIRYNSGNGIYGEYHGQRGDGIFLKRMPVAYKQEARLGKASILCCADGEVKEYDAEITRIDMNHKDSNKSFVIRVTDPELLSKTGGIIRGMSGSPVIQNGKVIGAVTHVFVQDASSGYGIFIENMLSVTGQKS